MSLMIDQKEKYIHENTQQYTTIYNNTQQYTTMHNNARRQVVQATFTNTRRYTEVHGASYVQDGTTCVRWGLMVARRQPGTT